MVIGSSLSHWIEPIRSSGDHLHSAYQRGITSLDGMFAMVALGHASHTLLFDGSPLGVVVEQVAAWHKLALSRKDAWSTDVCEAVLRAATALTVQRLAGECVFDYDGVVEEDYLHRCAANEGTQALAFYHVFKTMALLLMEQHEAALAAHRQVEARLDFLAVPSYYCYSQFCLHRAYLRVAASGLFPQDSPSHPGLSLRASLESDLQLFARWAAECPANFEAPRLWLSAELARLEGRENESVELLEEAVERAREERLHHLSGLFLLRVRDHWKTRRCRRLVHAAETAFSEAMTSWGATTLVSQRAPPVVQALSPNGSTGPLASVCTLLTNASGAQRAILLSLRDGGLSLAHGVTVLPHDALEVPVPLLRLALNTHQLVVADFTRPQQQERFACEEYLRTAQATAAVAWPLIAENGDQVGALYLEHRELRGIFSEAVLERLRPLVHHAALSLSSFEARLKRSRARVTESAAMSLRNGVQEVMWNAAAGMAGVAVVSFDNGRIQDANARLCALAGLDLHTLLRMSFTDLLAEDGRVGFEADRIAASTGRSATAAREVQLVAARRASPVTATRGGSPAFLRGSTASPSLGTRSQSTRATNSPITGRPGTPTGTKVWVKLTLSPLDADGLEQRIAASDSLPPVVALGATPRYLVVIVEEVSERKRLEHLVVDARTAAQRASHVKAEFITCMSHELRTPLSELLVTCTLRLRDPADSAAGVCGAGG